jgi:uncharacterized protein DUF4349/putative zinc finger protein
MNAATHPVAPEELMAFLDGELPAAQTQSVSIHIERCAECQEVLHSLRNTTHSLAGWTVLAAPTSANFEDRLSAIAPNVSSKTQNPRRLSPLMLLRRPWVLVPVSLIVVFALWTATVRMRAPQNRFESYIDFPKQAHPVPQQQEMAMKPESGDTGLDLLESAGAASHRDKFSSPYISKLPPAKPSTEFTRLESFAKAYRPPEPAPTAPMIARTVSLSLVVKDFDASRKSLDAILIRHNGYAANLAVNTEQGAARSLTASLRIPALQLAAAMNELKSLGRVETESQNGEEVTQQHADLVARLKNSRETEQRLQAILLQRTGKISDVLEVEQEIARVRGEIEQMEAEQKNLEHRVDFATIDLKFADEYKAQLGSPAISVSTQFHNALVNGYTNAADSLLGLLLFVVQYGPVLLLWIVILSSPAWLLWRRWRRASAVV